MTTPAPAGNTVLQSIKAEAVADGDAEQQQQQQQQQQAEQQQQAGAEQQLEQEARGWAEIPAMFGGMLMMLPALRAELEEVYSEDNCLDWGRRAAQLAAHYGAKPGIGLLWCGIIAQTLGFTVATVKAVAKVRADAAIDKASQSSRGAAQHVDAEQGKKPDQTAGHRVEFS